MAGRIRGRGTQGGKGGNGGRAVHGCLTDRSCAPVELCTLENHVQVGNCRACWAETRHVLFPLVVAALAAGAALGLVAGGWRGAAFAVWVVASLLGAAAVLALVRRRPASMLVLAAGALGIVLGVRRSCDPPLAPGVDDDVSRGQPVAVIGVVLRGPDPGQGHEGLPSWRVRLLVDGLAASPVGVAMTVRGSVRGLGPGDRVRANVRLREPLSFANPGADDPATRWRAMGIRFLGSANAAEITILEAGWAWHPRRVAHRARERLRAAIERQLPLRQSLLLRTAVLGERAAVDEETEAGFRVAGATHALSVSGLHLAVVALLAYVGARGVLGRFAWLALRVEPARAAAVIAMPAVVFYTLLTGEAVATWRSALMALALFGARALTRPPSLASAIAAAALVLVCGDPAVLLDLSFQLSFLSVIALAAFAGALTAPAGQGRLARLRSWFIRMGAASLAAGLATAPLVAHAFGEIAVASPLGNLILTPMVELLLVPLGLAGASVGSIARWLGWFPLALAGLAAELTLRVARLFHQFVPLVHVVPPGVGETALYGSAAFAALAAWTQPRRRWLCATAAAALAACALIPGQLRRQERQNSRSVRITFLDVGQGDAAVIQGPGGFVAVVDGGGLPGTPVDVGARVIEPFLRRQGIEVVDLVILSHPHPDHLTGLLRLMDAFRVRTLWTSGDERHPDHPRLLRLAAAQGASRPVPERMIVRGLELTPLGPWSGSRIGVPPGLGVNDASLTVRLSYAGRSVLFAGDLEADGETEMVGRARLGLSLRADVIKVPHHGSRTSSTTELIEAVGPALAVISCGRGNRFGFPHSDVVARYTERGSRIVRTDRDGAITVTIDPDGGMETTCARGCR